MSMNELKQQIREKAFDFPLIVVEKDDKEHWLGTVQVRLVREGDVLKLVGDDLEKTCVIVPRKQLEDYINFVDNLRTHPKSHVMLVKYQIYKELLESSTSKRLVLSDGKEMEKALEKVEKTK